MSVASSELFLCHVNELHDKGMNDTHIARVMGIPIIEFRIQVAKARLLVREHELIRRGEEIGTDFILKVLRMRARGYDEIHIARELKMTIADFRKEWHEMTLIRRKESEDLTDAGIEKGIRKSTDDGSKVGQNI